LDIILPWGQMSLWGATVITNPASTRNTGFWREYCTWLWGGFSVANPTLNKFLVYTIFFFYNFGLVALHLFFLHYDVGSSNQVGIEF
jgi:quinol-cytochrome oxidoreductase complex cytochrome b subunit